ncbi:hypothetical protein FOCC_FOCC016538, partial [Frankliniella occidentalis]
MLACLASSPTTSAAVLVCQRAPGKRHGDMVLHILALLLLLDMHPVCWSKRPSRPGVLQASRLVVELAKIEGCTKEPGNSISYFNFHTRMISKTDASIDVDYNISRSASRIDTVMIQLTKCREGISYNSCERYQNWRFDNNPCKGFDDPSAIWSFVIVKTHPHLTCPFKE